MKKIGVFSPSNNLLGVFPNRTKTGIENLRDIGYEIIFSTNYKRDNTYSKESICERIKEINELIDKDICCMIASIGGYLTTELLRYIDYEKIKKKNIVFCGSSDITSLLLAIYVKTKKKVLYGPTFTVNFSDYGGIDEYTKKYFVDCLENKSITYEPSLYSICEYIDWKELENKKIIKNKIIKDNDWKIVKKGYAKGKLIGGNLITIMLILGTEFLPLKTFNNSILFLEDCETNINEFCSFMECLKLNGVFERTKGIIIGKFDSPNLNKEISAFLSDYFHDYNIPIVSNVDFGHICPIMTIPIGSVAILECTNIIKFSINT